MYHAFFFHNSDLAKRLRDQNEENDNALIGEFDGFSYASWRRDAIFRSLEDMCVDGLLTEEEYEEIRKGCHSYNLPLSVDSLNAGDVLAATKKDKKMEAGHIKFILMDGIGKSFIDKTVTDEELLQAIREILI